MLLAQADAASAGHTLSQLWQVDAAGVSRQLKELWQMDGSGTPRLIYSVANLVLTPSDASAYIATKGSSSAYTNSITVSGFSGSATIVWMVPTGWSVASPGAATTAFKSPGLAPGTDVTDAGSVAVTTSGVTLTAPFNLYASNVGYS